MLFNSWQFIVCFLPVTLVGFFLLGRRNQGLAAGWLAGASLFFYGWWDARAVPLLLSSAGFNYLFGRKLSNLPTDRKVLRQRILILGVVFDLTILGFFKYANFFIDNANFLLKTTGAPLLPVVNIVLPIGISFFTFTQLAFLVDCYQGKVKERKVVHYLLFVTYFPHLIAGPVLHHSQMMPQFGNPRIYRPNASNIFDGLTIFTLGLAKKIILADGLADFVGSGFSAAVRGETLYFLDSWFTVISYALQIYFDFSGYSDMAIGLSLLFGVELPVNFNSPYKATSIIDFWRRWHISLSTFLRDYLYIPLGGNRLGEARRMFNLFATMVLGGLWHGASWTYVLWGAVHGFLLIMNHLWRAVWGDRRPFGPLTGPLGWSLTFFGVCGAWVLFRADNLRAVGRIYAGMLGLHGIVLPEQIAAIIPHGKSLFRTVGNLPGLGGGAVMGVFEQGTLILLGFLICVFGPQIRQLGKTSRLTLIGASSGFILNSIFFSAPKEFMYFQF